MARLIHVVASPEAALHLATLHRHRDREESEFGDELVPLSDPFQTTFIEMFENPDVIFTHPAPMISEIHDIDPNNFNTGHGSEKLRRLWGAFKSEFTTAYNNWKKSGQNDPTNFASFIRDRETGVNRWILLYGFHVLHGHPSIDFILRTIPSTAARETGLSRADAGTEPREQAATSSGSRSLVGHSGSGRRSNTDIVDRAVSVLDRLDSADAIDRREADMRTRRSQLAYINDLMSTVERMPEGTSGRLRFQRELDSVIDELLPPHN